MSNGFKENGVIAERKSYFGALSWKGYLDFDHPDHLLKD